MRVHGQSLPADTPTMANLKELCVGTCMVTDAAADALGRCRLSETARVAAETDCLGRTKRICRESGTDGSRRGPRPGLTRGIIAPGASPGPPQMIFEGTACRQF